MPSNFLTITTGDINGVGFEVTAKALLSLRSSFPAIFRQNVFFLFCAPLSSMKPNERKCHKKYLAHLSRAFQIIQMRLDDFSMLSRSRRFFSARHRKKIFSDLEKNHSLTTNKPALIFIESPDTAAHWVQTSAELCLSGFFSAMITAPLSKPLIQRSGFKEVGHTEILKKVCRTIKGKEFTPFMSFLGQEFNVAVATGHIPLNKVSSSLSPQRLQKLYRELTRMKRLFKDPRPIGILGLNPHAGDRGIIGQEELAWLNRFCKTQNQSVPLVPDAAFLPSQRKNYSFFLCLYHDQGLIPFKAIHGTHGAHITLGLPLIRTSVDHGTAFDLFGKDRADSSSMELAIKSATLLLKQGA